MVVKEYKGSTNSQELNYWLSKHLMIRRLKKDVLTELPPKRRIKMSVEISPKDKKELDKLMEAGEELRKRLEEEEGKRLDFNQLLQRMHNLNSDKDQLGEEVSNP